MNVDTGLRWMWFWAVILALLCDAPLVSMAYGEVISVTAKKERDRAAILKMAGCFAVDFHFEENHRPSSEISTAPYP